MRFESKKERIILNEYDKHNFKVVFDSLRFMLDKVENNEFKDTCAAILDFFNDLVDNYNYEDFEILDENFAPINLSKEE